MGFLTPALLAGAVLVVVLIVLHLVMGRGKRGKDSDGLKFGQ